MPDLLHSPPPLCGLGSVAPKSVRRPTNPIPNLRPTDLRATRPLRPYSNLREHSDRTATERRGYISLICGRLALLRRIVDQGGPGPPGTGWCLNTGRVRRTRPTFFSALVLEPCRERLVGTATAGRAVARKGVGESAVATSSPRPCARMSKTFDPDTDPDADLSRTLKPSRPSFRSLASFAGGRNYWPYSAQQVEVSHTRTRTRRTLFENG